MARRWENGFGLFVPGWPAAAPAFDDLEFRPRDQAAADLIFVQQLVEHAVVLSRMDPACPRPKRQNPRTPPNSGAGKRPDSAKLGLRWVDRDHVERGVVAVAGGLGWVNL